MTCPTLSTSTASWIVERQFRSVCTTTLATLRCTNISPGNNPTIWFAGTRLSAHPIHRYGGVCWPMRRAKKSGSRRVISAAQARLFANRLLKNRMGEPPGADGIDADATLGYRPPFLFAGGEPCSAFSPRAEALPSSLHTSHNVLRSNQL